MFYSKSCMFLEQLCCKDCVQQSICWRGSEAVCSSYISTNPLIPLLRWMPTINQTFYNIPLLNVTICYNSISVMSSVSDEFEEFKAPQHLTRSAPFDVYECVLRHKHFISTKYFHPNECYCYFSDDQLFSCLYCDIDALNMEIPLWFSVVKSLLYNKSFLGEIIKPFIKMI